MRRSLNSEAFFGMEEEHPPMRTEKLDDTSRCPDAESQRYDLALEKIRERSKVRLKHTWDHQAKH